MNFKTFLLFAITLIYSVHTAPIANSQISISSLQKACKNSSGEFTVSTSEDSTNYFCLHRYDATRSNNVASPVNSACFYIYNYVYCLDTRYSNIEHCNQSSDSYNYRTCSLDVYTLLEDRESQRQLRTYPEKERVSINAVQDQRECKEINGIVLSYKVMYQYICITPSYNYDYSRNKHCIVIDEKTYCINESLTSLDTCNKYSDIYNHNNCMNTLHEYGEVNGFKIDNDY